MNLYKALFIWTITFWLSGFSVIAQDSKNNESAIQLLEAMFDSVYGVDQARFEMFSRERINDELIKSHAAGVINFEPRKVFLRGFDEEGVLLNEVLYLKGQNNDNALISPNGFPYININLDPLGATMRRNRHFTILEAGGRYLVDMLVIGMEQYKLKGNVASRFQLIEMSKAEWKVVIFNADYKLIDYTVKKDQSIRELSNALGIPEYKIIELNDEVTGFDDELEKEQVILIPNLYAQKVEIILRTSDLIPIQVRIFDEKGLYSEYIYTVFDTHPVITKETFNSSNPAYTF